jgi:DNA-binding phage protein
MRAHALAPTLQLELYGIATEMKKQGLPADFITAAVETATEFEGVYDLMKLWINETDKKERDEIVADIQDMINDCEQEGREEAAYVRFNDLETIAKNVRAFKDSLLHTVMGKGGIKRLSELSHIPQPSLSRFFNSASMPHRATLLKIAKALKLDAVKIATEWSH